MLTADLAMSRQSGNRIEPRLIKPSDPRLLERAGDLIAVFARHRGARRQELDDALDEFIGVDPNYRLLRGWAKLLFDLSEFAVQSAVDPETLRETLFRRARQQHPVRDEAARTALHAEVAAELHCRPDDVASGLYADLSQNQRLVSLEEISARDLLDRYNLAQAQALLYRCQTLMLTLKPQEAAGYRQIFGAIKQYRLIHTITGNAAQGYTVTLDGPVSLFHRSQKYGIQMAVFLPALLHCQQWRLHAEIAGKSGPVYYDLTSEQTQLRSHYLTGLSQGRPDVEKLLKDWQKQPRVAVLEPAREVLDGRGFAWAPDLMVTDQSGRAPLYIELLGFWTPRSLDRQLREIAAIGVARYLLVASEELRCSRDELAEVSAQVLLYKTAIDVRAIEKVFAAL